LKGTSFDLSEYYTDDDLYNNDLFIDHIKYFLYRYDYELHNFVLLEQIIIIFFNNFVLLEQKSKYNNEEYAIYKKINKR
jgi:hypothetical protein